MFDGKFIDIHNLAMLYGNNLVKFPQPLYVLKHFRDYSTNVEFSSKHAINVKNSTLVKAQCA